MTIAVTFMPITHFFSFAHPFRGRNKDISQQTSFIPSHFLYNVDTKLLYSVSIQEDLIAVLALAIASFAWLMSSTLLSEPLWASSACVKDQLRQRKAGNNKKGNEKRVKLNTGGTHQQAFQLVQRLRNLLPQSGEDRLGFIDSFALNRCEA